MQRALGLARRGWGIRRRTRCRAVIVRGQEVVGEGYHAAMAASTPRRQPCGPLGRAAGATCTSRSNHARNRTDTSCAAALIAGFAASWWRSGIRIPPPAAGSESWSRRDPDDDRPEAAAAREPQRAVSPRTPFRPAMASSSWRSPSMVGPRCRAYDRLADRTAARAESIACGGMTRSPWHRHSTRRRSAPHGSRRTGATRASAPRRIRHAAPAPLSSRLARSADQGRMGHRGASSGSDAPRQLADAGVEVLVEETLHGALRALRAAAFAAFSPSPGAAHGVAARRLAATGSYLQAPIVWAQAPSPPSQFAPAVTIAGAPRWPIVARRSFG